MKKVLEIIAAAFIKKILSFSALHFACVYPTPRQLQSLLKGLEMAEKEHEDGAGDDKSEQVWHSYF